jgi:hypothetical protein
VNLSPTYADGHLPSRRQGIHTLRHSAASLLLAGGVTLSQVSQLLGHSEQRLTADLYGHLLEETAATGAGHMDRLLAAKVARFPGTVSVWIWAPRGLGGAHRLL